MAVFSDHLEREVRLERMRPDQVEAAKQERAAVYVPFGAIEWHGPHNPVGVDGIKAHEQLVGLALRAGGVVYPTVFFGSGGGHSGWPCTLLADRKPMSRLVTELLFGLQREGFRRIVLLAGHYPNASQYLLNAVYHYVDDGGTSLTLAAVESQIPDCRGDHAAKYETSYMLYLHPETVDTDWLQTVRPDEVIDSVNRVYRLDEEHKDHPCYGLSGIDPRGGNATAELGRQMTQRLIEYLHEWLDGKHPTAGDLPMERSPRD